MFTKSFKTIAALALISSSAAISMSPTPVEAGQCPWWQPNCTLSAAIQTNLTGTWRADNGGTYVIRQTGNNVSWTGRGGNWNNTFNGRIVGDRITGYWQDTASSQTQNSGQLVLRIHNNNKITLVSRTGAGSSHVWTRSSLGSLPLPLPLPGVQQTNLTGTWRADNGGTYVIRQTGNNVSWTGSGSNWNNTFNGSIVGDRITGYWQDTASSQTQNSGQLVLRIHNNNKITLVSRTGAGSSHVWTR